LWGIYLIIKRKYPGEITFVQESCLGLFDSIVKNMPELAVHYKGSPVGEGLVLLKGSLLNTGSKDISESMVEEKISVSLPEKFRWLTAKVVSTSPKVQAQVEISDRSLVLETGLFRCSEYVRFEALAEVPTKHPRDNKEAKSIEKRLIKALTINHRIADTQKIKRKDLPPSAYTLKRFKKILIGCFALMVVGMLFIASLSFTGWPGQLHYLILTGDGQTIEVKTKIYADGMMKVRGVQDRTYKETITAEQFFKTPGIVPKVVPDRSFRATMIFFIATYIGFPLSILAFIFRGHRKNKKLRQLLSIPE
jgi:hypothetical protein